MQHINQLNKCSLTLIILWTLSTKVVSVRQKVYVPYAFAFYEIVTNGNNFLMLSCSLFHLSCPGILCQHIFFPEALVILSKRRALGERKVCDKFPFPILDLSIKIEFLCSKCSCPCFMQESPCLPPPRSSRGEGGAHPLHPPPRSAPVYI